MGDNVGLMAAWDFPYRTSSPPPRFKSIWPLPLFVVPLYLLTQRYLLPAFIIRFAALGLNKQHKRLIIGVSVLKQDAKCIFKVLLSHFASLLFFIYSWMGRERKEKWSELLLSSTGIHSNAFATNLIIPWPFIFHLIEICVAQLQWQ